MRTAFLAAALLVSTLAACEDRRDEQFDSQTQNPNEQVGRQPGVGLDTTETGAAVRPSPAAGDVTPGAPVTPRDTERSVRAGERIPSSDTSREEAARVRGDSSVVDRDSLTAGDTARRPRQ